MKLGLEGKIAIVTGAAGGIGAAIAQLLAAEGSRVVIADIDGKRAQAKASEIVEAGGQAIGIQTDVIDQASVESLLHATASAFGGPDILVNNAGFTRDMRIARMSEADWDAVVDVILKGTFLCTRAVLPSMVERRWGRVINISSRAYLGNAGQANYSAAKAGLLGFTRAMALENGRFEITVNAVAPGMIGTDAIRALPHFETVRANAEKSTPIPRIGEVADIADAVAFLASERAGYITGEVLHVTGGRY